MIKKIRNKKRFDNHHVVITGAAKGIGAATAKRFHQLGAKVTLLGLEPDLLAALAEQLGERVFYAEVNVTDKSALQLAIKQSCDQFGEINTLIANAGIYNVSTLLDDELGAFAKTVDVNLFGVHNTIVAASPYMSRCDGYILTVSSLAALLNGPLMGSYAATKAAVEALTNSLRVELSREGITVGCAYFGAIDTDLVQGGKQHPALSQLEKISPDFIREPVPVSAAVDAIVDGVRKKSYRLWAPGWLGAFLLLRGVAQPLIEWKVMHSAKLKTALDIQKDKSRLGIFGNVSLGVSSISNKETEV